MRIKNVNVDTQFVIDELFKVITDQNGNPKPYLEPFLKDIKYANYIDDNGIEQEGKFTKHFIVIKIEEGYLHFSLQYLQKIQQTVKYQKPILKTETTRIETKPAVFDDTGKMIEEAEFENVEKITETGKFENVEKITETTEVKYKRLDKIMSEEDKVYFNNNVLLPVLRNDKKFQLKMNTRQALTIKVFNNKSINEKPLFELMPDTPEYTAFNKKIHNSLGSIGGGKHAMATQTYYLPTDEKKCIEALNYLWEYAFEEILILKENIQLQAKTIEDKIDNVSLENINAIDVNIVNHNNEIRNSINIDIFDVYSYIVENGVVNDEYISFSDKRFVNEAGVRTKKDIMIPSEVVKHVYEAISNDDILVPVAKVLESDNKNNFAEAMNNSFIA